MIWVLHIWRSYDEPIYAVFKTEAGARVFLDDFVKTHWVRLEEEFGNMPTEPDVRIEQYFEYQFKYFGMHSYTLKEMEVGE